MMKKEDILNHLDYESYYRSNLDKFRIESLGKGKGLCPFHDDQNPSLSVNYETGLWNCFAGCGGGDAISFYQRLKGCDFKEALKRIAKFQGFPESTFEQKVVASFDYKAPEGNLLYTKERLEPGRNGRNKEFRFKSREAGEYVFKRGSDPVPYNLPELIKSKYVVFVEGEGKVDFLGSWGIVATCLDSGANSSWKDYYLQYFENKEKVAILPDNDQPGRSYAERLAKELNGTVDEIKIVDLPGLEEGEDIIDWSMTDGNNREKLIDNIKTSPQWILEDTTEFEELIEKPFSVMGAELMTLDIRVEWVIENLLPKESISMLYGKGGVGKTYLSLNISKAVSEGIPFWGLETQRLPVYYFDYENSLPVLVERVKKINVKEVHFIHPGITVPPPRLDSQNWTQYRDLPCSLIIIDTLRASQDKDENSSKEMAEVMNSLKQLRDRGNTILLLHHTPKSDDQQYKGSTVISDLCDHTLCLYKTGSSYYFGTGDKSRYKPFSLLIDFHPESGGFISAEEKYSEEIWDMIRNNYQLNKTDLINKITSGLEINQKTARELLAKGLNILWLETKGRNNAKVYEAIADVF
jgi:putative DNA primase/helicase